MSANTYKGHWYFHLMNPIAQVVVIYQYHIATQFIPSIYWINSPLKI